MPERIYKLQPDRTLHLRGFDSLGAAAALHHATPNSFKVSGVFRDPADFCVLVLHDADNFYEHPSIRYLPDTNFAGLTLSFDVRYSGLRPLDSPRYATIDWPYLDVIRPDGTTANIPLFHHAQFVSGSYLSASSQFTIVDAGLKEFDRVTLWYLNFAFDYIVPKTQCSFAFAPKGGGAVHSLTIDGMSYSYTEVEGDTAYTIAQRLVDLAAASPWVSVIRTFGQVDLRASKDDGVPFVVSASSSPDTFTLTGVGAATVARSLATQINTVNWTALKVLLPISAEAVGSTVTIRAVRAGVDGNSIRMYAVSKNARLTTSSPTAALSGGSSDATWRVTLNFSTLGIPDIRQAWLTFAPPLADGQSFTDTEWEATFTNWTLSGQEDRKTLQVAGPGSVRIEDNSPACTYTGKWNVESGFYSRGYAVRSTAPGDSVRINYECDAPHHLYLGTSLYKDRGTVTVHLDGVALSNLNCYLDNEPAVVTRRSLGASVPPGRHTVTLAASSGFFYFDFLEAVVASDPPAPRRSQPDLSPALDYSTDHTYKLSPARILWNFDQLGYSGPLNEYIGVFWWNQRKRVNAIIPTATITFSGSFKPDDQIFVSIGGQPVGKTVFPGEDTAVIATHFANFINATYVGVWASANANVLTITASSPTPAYAYTLSASVVRVAGSTGAAALAGTLQNGIEGTWVVDPTQSPALNRGAREWHADFYAQCAARNRDVVTAASMELVNPPTGFAAQFADRTPVITSVGFGSLSSSHCAFNSAMLAYQQSVYDSIATLMTSSGVTPHIQFGEFCWWYFPLAHGGSMAFYDAETKAAAQEKLERPLEIFKSADDDPMVNGGADAAFLRNRLRDHVIALTSFIRSHHPTARFEVLYPYDVNYPAVVGVHNLGGRLLNFINFPVEWRHQETSGFDTLKVEALDFGSSSRNLDLVRDAVNFPIDTGWSKPALRYMIPIFNGGCPWRQEYRIARQAGIPYINLWAFDHVCIFNLDLTVPGRPGRAARFA